MCLLVLSASKRAPDPSGLTRLHERIDDARVSQQPVAFVQHHNSEGLNELGIRIGRYEPIFSAERNLSDGLIDFILSSSVRQVSLAGVADVKLFEQIRSILTRAGLAAELDRAAILSK